MNRHSSSTDKLVPAAVILKVRDNKHSEKLRNSSIYPVGKDYWYKFDSGPESQGSFRHASRSIA